MQQFFFCFLLFWVLCLVTGAEQKKRDNIPFLNFYAAVFFCFLLFWFLCLVTKILCSSFFLFLIVLVSLPCHKNFMQQFFSVSYCFGFSALSQKFYAAVFFCFLLFWFLCLVTGVFLIFMQQFFFCFLLFRVLCLVTGAERLLVAKQLVLLKQLGTEWQLLHRVPACRFNLLRRFQHPTFLKDTRHPLLVE